MFSSPLTSPPATNSSASRRKIQRPIISPATPLESILPRPSVSVHSKPFTATLLPLESTLTKKPGERCPDMVNQISRGRASCAATILLRGAAWIDANNFHGVRLETDLREAHPELRLNSEHLVMEYGPVKFKTRNEELWLPASADYYAFFRGHRFHRRHTFTNYVLFSIDDKQKIGEPPKEKTAAASASAGNPSN